MPNDTSLASQAIDPHAHHSVLRERILEHVFVGDLLRLLWRKRIWDLEVLRSEFDGYGYDLVLSRGKIVRHVQLKAVREGGAASTAKLTLGLGDKPSGCAISVVIDDDLNVRRFLWFGGAPGEPLPEISALRVAKHTKANSDGLKLERQNHRVVPYSRFERLETMEAVLQRLFEVA